jgi:hypothetical protein
MMFEATAPDLPLVKKPRDTRRTMMSLPVHRRGGGVEAGEGRKEGRR